MATANEEFYCNPDECPTKNCECCRAKRTTFFAPTDSYRTGKGVSPNGYYSSGGIVRTKGADGKIHYNYARNPIIYPPKTEDK